MAEAIVDLLKSPEITEKDRGKHRRNSTGKLTSLSCSEKTLPSYLRVSTRSCHDVCKYGKKHDFEFKPRHSFPREFIRRVGRDKPMSESLDSSLGIVASKGTRSTPLKSKPNLSQGTGNCSQDPASAIKLREVIKSKKPRELTTGKGKLLCEDRKNDTMTTQPNGSSVNKFQNSRSSSSEPSSRVKLGRQKISQSLKNFRESSAQSLPKSRAAGVSNSSAAASLRSKAALQKSISSPSGERHSEVGSRKKKGISKADSGKVVKPSKSPSSLGSLLSSSRNLKTRSHRGLEDCPLAENQNNIKDSGTEQHGKEEPKDENHCAVEEKRLYMIKMEDENILLESQQNRRCIIESSPPESTSQPESSSLPPPSLTALEGEDFGVTNSENGTSGDQESVETMTVDGNDYGKEEDDDEEENEISVYTVSESEDGSPSERSETISGSQVQSSAGEHSSRVKEDNISEGKGGQSKQHKFRRGKIVDIQSEYSCPRRLKFRRGRYLGESKSQRPDELLKFKKTEEGEHEDDTDRASEKVVLRHQDVQGKRDAQGLFNNVIEETASKLVEAQKSKVKALVGAFETVISLQDIKPSGNAVASCQSQEVLD